MSDATNDDLLALHQALLDGEVSAPWRLAEALVPILRMRLVRLDSKLADPQIVESAIGQSVATYLTRPEAYDPSRGPLAAYLAMDAAGDVKNELDKRRREVPIDPAVDKLVVELGRGSRNSTVEEDALDAADRFDVPKEELEAIREQVESFSPRDRELAQLVADRERSTAVWAHVLGITHLPLHVQAREVKRQKDRIKKKLIRVGERRG